MSKTPSRGLRLACLALLVAGCSSTAPPPEEVGARLLVLNKNAATATVYDLGTGEATATMPTGTGPHEAVVLPDGTTAVVTDYGQQSPGNSLTLLDLDAGERLRTLDLGAITRPHGIVVLGPTQVLVTSETTRQIAAVDTETGTVVYTAPTDGDGSHMVALAPDGQTAYTANISSGDVSKIDLASRRVTARAQIDPVAEAIAISPDGEEVWAASQQTGAVVALDAETLEERARTTVGGRPIRLTVTPDGERVLVTSVSSSRLTVLDASSLEEIGAVDLGLGASPVGTLVSADGSRAFVSLLQLDQVAEVDLATFEVVRTFATGRVPDGLALAP